MVSLILTSGLSKRNFIKKIEMEVKIKKIIILAALILTSGLNKRKLKKKQIIGHPDLTSG